MPLASPRYVFSPAVVAGAPDDPGVYALYAGNRLVGVGAASGRTSADTIRARLLAHLRTETEPAVTHYKWELCSDPLTRRAEHVLRIGGHVVLY